MLNLEPILKKKKTTPTPQYSLLQWLQCWGSNLYESHETTAPMQDNLKIINMIGKFV